MEYGAALTYPRQDPDWIKKLIIGGVANLFPIANFLLVGYGIEVVRRVAQGQATGLPEWTDLGAYLKRGFLATVATVVYMLPLLLVSACINIPATIALSDSSGQIASGNEGIYLGLQACFGIILLVYLVVFMMLYTAGMGRYAVTDRLGAFFEFGPLFSAVTSRFGVYLMIGIVYGVIGVVAALVGTLVCFVGLVITIPYVFLVYAHLTGQAQATAGAPA